MKSKLYLPRLVGGSKTLTSIEKHQKKKKHQRLLKTQRKSKRKLTKIREKLDFLEYRDGDEGIHGQDLLQKTMKLQTKLGEVRQKLDCLENKDKSENLKSTH